MYAVKNFDHLLGTPGFSNQLLKNHFALYEGYVTNTNKLSELLREAAPGSPQYNELKRRFGWEWNGMRLHELYFDNMKNGGSTIAGTRIAALIKESFASHEAWEKDFKGAGAMRGIGWVVLYHDPEADKLINSWVNEHDTGHLSGANPLLVMDVFEHAFMLDYGMKRADYIETFMHSIDWSAVESRLG